MDPQPIFQHTPNRSLEWDGHEPAPFPPRHIEGQCVHRWPSTQNPAEMVFYHQASRCQFSQQRGAPPDFAIPTVRGSDNLEFMTPSPRPMTVFHHQSFANPNINHENSSQAQQFNQSHDDISNCSTGFELQQLIPTSQNIYQDLSRENSGHHSFTTSNSQISNNQSLNRENLDHSLFTGSGSQITNNQITGYENSQHLFNGLESQSTNDHLISSSEESFESSEAPPSNIIPNQINHNNAESDNGGASNMPWEPLAHTCNSDSEESSAEWHDMFLKYIVYSRQGVDPTSGPTIAKNRAPKIYKTTFKARKFPLDLNNYSFSELKEQLFALSDQMGKEAEGNSFIFKAADSTNSVSFMGYINQHDVYSKGAEMKLANDDDVEQFFLAVLANPKKVSGIDIEMDGPSKKKLEADRLLSMKQHQLQAKNITQDIDTSNSDLAHSNPIDPVETALSALMLKYSTANNNNSEGWRVYKHDDVTKVMPMNFQLLGIWAEKMVSKPEEVTLDIPPECDGFEWTNLKHPVSMQTPLSSSKSMTQKVSPITPGTISEAQGYDIVVDPYDLERIRYNATMEDYMAFAAVRVSQRDKTCKILLEYDIKRFDAFLFPEETGLEDLIDMGIKRGTAMRLMNCPRRFYQHLINDEINNPKPPFDSSMVI